MVDMEENDEDPKFAQLSTNFINWLKQNGTNISPKIEIMDFRHRGAGRGVVAKAEIVEDEELFSVPNKAILTSETSSLPSSVKDLLSDPWLSLILAMIHEYQLGSHSKWKAYSDLLPTSFDTLMYWTEDELKLLEGSAVVGKIGKAEADCIFNDQIIPIVRDNERTFNATELNDRDVLSLCHRMGSTIMAYAFDLESNSQPQNEGEDGWEEDSDEERTLRKGMVPLADMLNADGDRNNARLFYEDDRVVMKTIKPVEKGEELFNDYGALPRADVLRRYGYITDNYAKYDVVEISLDIVRTIASRKLKMTRDDIEARVDYLEQQDAYDDGYDIALPSNDNDQFPDELKILLNTLTSSPAEFDKLKQKDKPPKAELSFESLNLLQAILLQRKSMYPQEDIRSLGETTDPSTTAGHSTGPAHRKRMQMAEQVVHGELAVLDKALSVVQDALKNAQKRAATEGKVQGASKKQKREHAR